ncbi:MAG TPA: transcriptional regulator [Pseudonocardiaceae bacterium]|jgi:hypothetical protein
MMTSAVTFAVVLPGLLVAHNVADHWLQTDHQAGHKGLSGWPGRIACASHVATYTLTTVATVALLWWLLDLPISPLGFVAGQLVSAVTHYWADRRTTLAELCERLGKGDFYRLGTPRLVQATVSRPHGNLDDQGTAKQVVTLWGLDGKPVMWDGPSLGTGAYVLDQSWHWFWLFAAALLTAVIV